jgi:hypothetical protein
VVVVEQTLSAQTLRAVQPQALAAQDQRIPLQVPQLLERVAVAVARGVVLVALVVREVVVLAEAMTQLARQVLPIQAAVVALVVTHLPAQTAALAAVA